MSPDALRDLQAFQEEEWVTHQFFLVLGIVAGICLVGWVVLTMLEWWGTRPPRS